MIQFAGKSVRAVRAVTSTLLLALGLVSTAAAQAPGTAGLASPADQPAEVPARVGEPVELQVIASRDGQARAGEALTWSLESPGSGQLERLDASSRAAGEGVAAGSGRARFTAATAGRHGITVQMPRDAGCASADCVLVAHRIVVLASAADVADTGEKQRDLRWVAGAGAGLALIGAASTTGSDGDGNNGSSTGTLAILAGNGQSGLANNPLPIPLEVVALNGGGAASGVTIQWTVTGGATLSAATATTGADGRARVNVTSLGPGPGPVTVTATRTDNSVGAVFTLTINIAALDKISGDGQTTPVDTTTAAPLVVRTQLNGAPQAGVAVTWQVISGNGSLSGVTAVSDANGLAQAFVDAGPFPGTITVRASRADSPLLQQTFTVNAVELRDLAIVSGNNQTEAQGYPLPNPLVVLATDNGAPDPGVTIFWSASPGVQLSSNSTITDGAGESTITVTDTGFDLDPFTVTAQRADQPGLSVTFSFNITPPTLSVVAGDGQSGLAGSQAATPVQVQLLDGNGAPMAGQTVAWTVESGSATLSTPMSMTDAGGNADVGFSYGSQPGPIVIRASVFNDGATADASATSQPPGGIAAASGDGQTGDPGDPLAQPLVIQLVDPAPDLSGVPISFVVVSGSATLAPANTVTDAAGQASTQVTLGLTPGPVVIEATAPGGVVTQFTATVTGTLVVTSVTAPTGDGQTLTPGTPSAPMELTLNGNGTPLAGQTVTWTTTGGTLDSATTVTDATGKTSNRVTVTGSGTTVVTASFPTFNEFVGSSVSFTHNSNLAALPSLSINEASVAEALDAACLTLGGSGTLTPEEQDLVDQCNALILASTTDPGAVGEALTAMLPDVAQTQADAGKAAVGAQFNNLNTRMVGLRSGAPVAKLSFAGLTLAASGGRVALAPLGLSLLGAAETAPAEEMAFEKWGFFVSGNIGRGESDPTRLTPRYDFDVEGLTAGVDYRWSDSLVLGAALGYTRQDTDLSGGQGSVEMQGLSLSGYSTWYHGNDWYLDSVVTLGNNQYDHARRIQYVLPGEVVDQVAKADSDGTDLSATVTFGRDFSRGAWTFGAYGRAAYSRLGFDAFQEEVDDSLNGNGLALRVESRTVTGLSSTLGGKAAYAHSASWGILVPQLEAEWVHEYGSDTEAFRGFFVDDPTQTPILVLGDDLDNDYFRIGLGLSLVLTEGRSGFITYERLVARSGIDQQTLSLGFRWEF
ncbi:autotransporter domain-containing protein [Arenimonas sp. MALMAid1274]|uniref:autotransporter domain-containing protein n=1 Tax=Arenimonas sp. MALMAid1274 TaxID=3411630 RepID=UPI003BA32D65